MMGQSGGRSRNHRLGRGAGVRATQRERSYVDPPRTGEWEEVDLGGPSRGIADDVWLKSLLLIGGIGLLTACMVFALWLGQLLGIVK